MKRETDGNDPDPKRLRDVQLALLNIEQAAKYLGRTVKSIRDLERKRVLRPVRLDRRFSSDGAIWMS